METKQLSKLEKLGLVSDFYYDHRETLEVNGAIASGNFTNSWEHLHKLIELIRTIETKDVVHFGSVTITGSGIQMPNNVEDVFESCVEYAIEYAKGRENRLTLAIIDDYEMARKTTENIHRGKVIVEIGKWLSKLSDDEVYLLNCSETDGDCFHIDEYNDAIRFIDRDGYSVAWNNYSCDGDSWVVDMVGTSDMRMLVRLLKNIAGNKRVTNMSLVHSVAIMEEKKHLELS